MTRGRIVVGYDRSADAKAAAAWALDEAARLGATVEFCYAYDWPTWSPAASMIPSPAVYPDGEADRAIRANLEDAVADARRTHPAVTTRIVISNGPAAPTLIARSGTADLVVLGSRGHSALSSIGSVGVAVTAHAHCPVVAIRGESAPDAPVVVGVDDSGCAQRALDFAAEQATARGVPLRVLRAESFTTGRWGRERPFLTETVVQGEQHRLDDLVDRWREKYPALTVTAEFVRGHAGDVLLAAAAGAQLVVVGSRGHGSVTGMLLGSVSQAVLHRSPVPVAVVREVPAGTDRD